MKKRILAMLAALSLTVAVLTVPAGACTAKQLKTADALHSLGLFLGSEFGYELDRTLTRAEGLTLLVRILGAESEAQSQSWSIPFSDVEDWALPYVGYAWNHGITNGVGEAQFGSEETLMDCEFITMCLRALGYSDSGANRQFVWENPYRLAYEIKVIDKYQRVQKFTRGDTVEVVWNCLAAGLNGEDRTMADVLTENGVLTREGIEKAKTIREKGIVRTWEEFCALASGEQDAYYNGFASPNDFFIWLSQVKSDDMLSSAGSEVR